MAIKRDFRKLAPATQAELRRVAVAMVRDGKTRVEAAATVGVNRRFVGQWVKVAAQRGEAVLAGRRRGRRPGEQKALSAAQEDRLRVLVARGCPDQFGLSFALWTRQVKAPERKSLTEAAGQSGCAGVKLRQQMAFVGKRQGPGDEERGALCSGSLCGSD